MLRRITITAIILSLVLSCFVTSYAAGFEYGDKSQFPGLEQFADEKYIIYSNADTNMVELAVITTDDSELSIIAEIYGQVIFEKRHEISPEEGREFTEGKYIPLLSRKELFLSSNSYTKIRKWIYEDNKWRALGDPEQNEIICTNYNEIYYSSFLVIEKINKEKTGISSVICSGKYFVDYEATDEEERGKYKYYISFSKDGIVPEKKIEVPNHDNGRLLGAFSGGGLTVVIFETNNNIPVKYRHQGFHNGGIYYFNDDLELVRSRGSKGLEFCIGFYDGYFYFERDWYYETGKFNKEYYKTTDGSEEISIDEDEFKEVRNITDQMKTVCGKYVQHRQRSNDVKISDDRNGEMYTVVYEKEKTINYNPVSGYGYWGKTMFSKWAIQTLGEEDQYISVDYIYDIRLPDIDRTKTKYRITRGIWATDEYVYVDQDIEFVYRIPMSQFLNQIYVKYNDKILAFDTPPVTENDRTLVPMRFLFEQMGAEVDWDEATQTATATITEDESKTARKVSFSIDNKKASVNGAQKTMDVPARLVNDKTMIPLRFLSENLGYSVEWDEETRTAVITG